MARGFSIFVDIGARLLPSIDLSIGKVDRAFAKLNRNLKVKSIETTAAMKSVAASMKPLATMAAAGGLTMGLDGIFKDGAEFRHNVAMLKVAGNSMADVGRAITAVHRTIADVPTSTLNDNLKILRETTLAYGSLGHAIDNLGFNAKMGTLMSNMMGDGYDRAAGFNQLVRGLEMRSGKLNAVDYQRQAGALFRAFSVSGGTVNPENFLGFMQQAGLAARGFSESFMARVVPSMIQQFGGERAGTAFTALYNQLNGTVSMGGKRITDEWVRLGLVPARGTGDNLSRTGWSPGSVKEYGLSMRDPLAWIEQVAFPAFRAHGIDTNNADVMRLQAQKMFGRETGKRLADTFFNPGQLARIKADMALYDRAMGPDKAFAEAMRSDPRMALASIASSFENLKTTIGDKLMTPAVLAGVNNLARGLNVLAGVFDAHPTFARGVTALMGFGAVAATMKLFGASLSFLKLPFNWLMDAVGSQAFLGMRLGFAALAELGIGPLVAVVAPFAAGLVAVGAALAFIVAKWDGIKAFIAGFGEGFMKGIAPYVPLLGKIGADLSAAFAPLAAILRPVFNLIGSIFGAPNVAAWRRNGMSLGEMVGSLAGKFLWLISKITGAFAALTRFFTINPGAMTTAPAAPGFTGKRALGGPVHGGRPYLVGERGAEIFVPTGAGRIVPHGAGLGAGVSTVNATFHINGAQDPKAIAREVDVYLARLARRQDAALND